MVKEGNDTMAKNPNRIKEPLFDRVFYIVTFIILLAILVIIIYPLWFVLMASCSDAQYVNNGDILLYPKGFTTLGYERTIANMNIWIGYANTILYTVGGTVVGTFCTVVAGYALSRKDLPGHGIIMKLFVFTMYFSGGLIPSYLLIQKLHLMNTIWVMMIPTAVNVYNVIIARSFVESLPQELYEASQLDGCSHFKYFYMVALPLSKAVVSVLFLYYFVGHWNDYFSGLMYINDEGLKPLQLILRDILLRNQAFANGAGIGSNTGGASYAQTYADQIKFGAIIVSTLPLLCIYPFIQKYFEKGVMIGAVKG